MRTGGGGHVSFVPHPSVGGVDVDDQDLLFELSGGRQHPSGPHDQ